MNQKTILLNHVASLDMTELVYGRAWVLQGIGGDLYIEVPWLEPVEGCNQADGRTFFPAEYLKECDDTHAAILVERVESEIPAT